MATGQIALMRHCASSHNSSGMENFDSGDPDLSIAGIEQAHRCGQFFRENKLLRDLDVDLVLCSKTTRATTSARIISEYIGAEVLQHAGLGEILWGTWAGRSQAEMFTKDQQARADKEGLSYRPNAEAETMLEVHERFAAIVEKYGAPGTLFVSHGFATKSFLAVELGESRSWARKLPFKNGQILQADLSAASGIGAIQSLFRPDMDDALAFELGDALVV